MLKVDRLRKTFNMRILGDKVIEGCDAVSFDVVGGRFLGLSGPSGVGKSTVLKCIYRTYLPTDGNVWFDSRLFGRVNLASIADHMVLDMRNTEIGYVSQFLRVIPRVSARDIVADSLLARKEISQCKAKKRAGELLERLHISPNLFDAYPSTFSGGEQQRINIARSVIWEPRLLLLDEPTASLDKNSISVVTDILMELKNAGTAMIGIFHDSSIMERLSDEIYRI